LGSELILILLASLGGGLLGCMTGLMPGLHSNNVASLIGASPGLVVGAVTLGTMEGDETGWALIASSIVMACAVAHTVANIVPSIYLAVPDADTALSVLPGHRMVMAGRGTEALRVSVTSSLASLALALVLAVPMARLMTGLVYGPLVASWGPVLLAVSVIMILKESKKEGGPRNLGGWHASMASAGVFMASGALGHMALFQAERIAPLFIGLFGIPMVLVAMMFRPEDPVFEREESRHRSTRPPWGPVLKGSLAGSLVGWFPGVSSAQATVLAVVGEVDNGDEVEGARRFVTGVSAVNTANAVFTLVALVTLLRVRSGAAEAVSVLMAWEAPPWSGGPLPGVEVTVLLLAAAVGGIMAAPVTLLVGRWFERLLPAMSDPWLLFGLLVLLVILASWGGGGTALIVLLAASALGTLPPLLGLMRVHLMGALTLPLALGLIIG
jgi:putative membrane protein